MGGKLGRVHVGRKRQKGCQYAERGGAVWVQEKVKEKGY